MVQWVKDPALSLRRSAQVRPWPGNFHMPWVWSQKEKTKNTKSTGMIHPILTGDEKPVVVPTAEEA